MAAAAATYRMVLAYDGTRYHGWQIQPGVATVQGEVGQALAAVTGERPVISAAGRTDAGAHAHGQVISFTLRSGRSPRALAKGCNARLPEDIEVLDTALMDPSFHARRQAWRRTYRYLIRDAAVADPGGRQYEWRLTSPLDLAPMRAGTRLLIGTHDFSAFGRSPVPGGSAIRTVDRAEVERCHGVVRLEVRADAFMRGMMRNIAGALVALGSGRSSLSELARAVADPSAASPAWPTAPAHGLHQWQVEYRAQPAGGGE